MQNVCRKVSKKLVRSCFVLLVILGGTLTAFSQSVSVNTTGSPPNASAGLDVDFPNLGFLIPRVALSGTTSFSPLTAHVAGMMVYNTAIAGDVVPAFYLNDGSKWLLCESSGISAGDMQYWNGNTWDIISAGQTGQLLQLGSTGIPVWVGAGYATLIAVPISALTSTTASSGGNITSDGGFSITSRGVCWNTSSNPTIALATKTIDGAGSGSYVSNLTGLTAGTIYYLRAYATNITGTVYGNQVIFKTP